MHEISICRALLQQVILIAEEHQAEEVKVIKLRIGHLSGIEAKLLQRSFPMVCHGTIAQNATLEIVTSAVSVYCDLCDLKSDVERDQLRCYNCDNPNVQLLSGDEMILESVTLGQQGETEERYVH